MVFHLTQNFVRIFLSIAVLSALVSCGGGGGGGGTAHNHAPVAGFEATPVSGQTPLEVSFDASASSDADGDFLTYEWVFGDGGTASSASPLCAHLYNAVGTHTATLTVSDGRDASATAEVEVVVSAAPLLNQEPVASLSADPLEGNAPLTVSFDASTSTDADNDALIYAWDFGDGQTAEGASSTVDHEYDEAGEFTATVTVSDGNGGEDQASASITVEIALPPAIFTDTETGMEFVYVPPGTFQMGDNFGDGQPNQLPVHSVTITKGFYLGKYEVTQRQWFTVMGSFPSDGVSGDSYPVNDISWNAVQNFIGNLESATGEDYRLPTEAEWEYAARSGGLIQKYAGTSDDAEAPTFVWYGQNSGNSAQPVGQKLPNALGLHDMSGNVSEWVNDNISSMANYYLVSPSTDPQGPEWDGFTAKAFRGGGYGGLNLIGFTTMNRGGYGINDSMNDLGFRLLRVIPEE